MSYCSTSAKTQKLIVIHIGQSNATDMFSYYAAAYPPWPNPIYTGSFTGVRTYYNDTLATWNSGVNTWYPNAGGTTYGISASIAYRLKNSYGRDCVHMNISLGGTYLYQGAGSMDWNVNSVAKSYAKLITDTAAMVAAIADSSYTAVFVWDHGQADSDTPTHATAYQANLTAFINAVRTNTGFTTAPFIMNKLNAATTLVTYPEIATVRTAQVAVSVGGGSAISGVYLIDNDDLPLGADNIHYRQEVTVDGVGNRVADKINSLI